MRGFKHLSRRKGGEKCFGCCVENKGTELDQGEMSLDYCTRRLEIKTRPDYSPPHGRWAVRWYVNLTRSWIGNLHPATLSLLETLSESLDYHSSESQELPLSNKNIHCLASYLTVGRR